MENFQGELVRLSLQTDAFLGEMDEFIDRLHTAFHLDFQLAPGI